WAGKNRSNSNRFLRPAAGNRFLAFWLFGFLAFVRVAHRIKCCRRSRWGCYGPFVPARSLAKPIASYGYLQTSGEEHGCPLAAYAQSALVNEEPAGTRAREDCKETPLLTPGCRGEAPHQAAVGRWAGRRWRPAQRPTAAKSCHAVAVKPANGLATTKASA